VANLRKNGSPVVNLAAISAFGRFQGGDVRNL
jgi:hypothetical protein